MQLVARKQNTSDLCHTWGKSIPLSGQLTPERRNGTWRTNTNAWPNIHIHTAQCAHTHTHTHTHNPTYTQHRPSAIRFPSPISTHGPAVSLLYILTIRWHPRALSPAGGERDECIMTTTFWRTQIDSSAWCRIHVCCPDVDGMGKSLLPSPCAASKVSRAGPPNLACPCFCMHVCMCAPCIYAHLHVKCAERESAWKAQRRRERAGGGGTEPHTQTYTGNHWVYVCAWRGQCSFTCFLI